MFTVTRGIESTDILSCPIDYTGPSLKLRGVNFEVDVRGKFFFFTENGGCLERIARSDG